MAFKKLLIDEAKNRDLEMEGYAVLPFLTNKEVEELSGFFYAHHTQLPDGMYATSHSNDLSVRKSMNDKIQNLCKRAINQHFINAKALGATFMAKSKGENGSIHPHQDWNIVDENLFNSYNVWLPLVDTNMQNGTLMILPKSHLQCKNIRGLNISSSYEKVNSEVWDFMVPINLKAGEALVYDHRLLHASGLNYTDVPRLVIVYGLIPEMADMRYYFGRNDVIEEYECSPDYYFNENILLEPTTLKQISIAKNRNPSFGLDDLKRYYRKKTSLWDRVFSLFSKKAK